MSFYKLMHKFQQFCKAFANVSSANIKFSETQLSKMIQSEGFLNPLDNIFGPLSSITLLNSIANPYLREFKNENITKEIKNKGVGDLLADTRFNILG